MTAYKFLLTIALATFGFTVTAHARSGYDDRNDRDRGSKNISKTFEATGVLQCKNMTHTSGKKCDLQLVRLSDREVFDVETNAELIEIHCNDHKDVKIHVSGKYEVRTIFGNDRIKVENFDAVKKLESSDVKNLLGTKIVKEYDRRHFFDGPIGKEI